MTKDLTGQALREINKANNILVVFKNDASGDSLSASLGLFKAFKNMGKKTTLATKDQIDSKFSFLPLVSDVRNDLENREGMLVVDIKDGQNKVDEFWYEKEKESVKVFIAPKKGTVFKLEDVKTFIKGPKPDLVITVGAHFPEALGSLYTQNTQVFFENPVINIDISSSNDFFGSVDLVDLTATSNSEIVFNLLSEITDLEIDDDLATVLLAGIVAKTDSFQSIKTTPKSFFTSSKLIQLGARHNEIIKNFYKTKKLSLLKLWGRALAQLSIQPQFSLASSVIRLKDFKPLTASSDNVKQVMEELVSTLSDVSLIFLLAEVKPRKILGFIFARRQMNPEDLFTILKAKRINPELAEFELKNIFLKEAESRVKGKIVDWLKVA